MSPWRIQKPEDEEKGKKKVEGGATIPWYAVFPFGGVAYGTQEAQLLQRQAYRAGITWLSRQKRSNGGPVALI